MSEQQPLLELPAWEGQEEIESTRRGPVKLVQIDRQQKTMAIIDVEELIRQDHKARALWHVTGKLALSGFAEGLRGEEGGAGRPAWDPRLLVSIWVYCYSEQISSAREIERLMEYEPGLQWLSGLTVINHHTLSDFRVRHKAALDELLIRLLALLEEAGMISLERLMLDGTKIRAQAGGDSMRRRGTISRRLEEAREVIRQMGDPRQERPSRREAAQRRAAREQVNRLEKALSELAEVENSKHSRQEKQAVRASVSDRQARVMKMAGRICAQLQPTSQYRSEPQGDRGSRGDASSQRQRAIAAGHRSPGSYAGTPTRASGGRWRLHQSWQHSRDERTGHRFHWALERPGGQTPSALASLRHFTRVRSGGFPVAGRPERIALSGWAGGAICTAKPLW